MRRGGSVAEEVGINESTVRSVFRDYVSELEQHIRFETVIAQLAANGMSLAAGQCVASSRAINCSAIGHGP